MNLLQRMTVRSLLQNKLRTLLTILGIALGVAILLAINLANETALNNFKDSLDRIAGKSNLMIRPAQAVSVDETVLKQLQWLWLINGKFTPLIQQTALLPQAEKSGQRQRSGNRQKIQNLTRQNIENDRTEQVSTGSPDEAQTVIQVVGVDMLADFSFRNYEWERSDTVQGGPAESTLSILEPGRCFITENLADVRDLKVGDEFPLLINDAEQSLTVAGILDQKGLGGAYSGNLILMDIASIQSAFGMTGQISQIDLIIPEDQIVAVQQKLRQDLPDVLAVDRPARRGEQVEKMLKAYQYNLTMLSFIALLVGVFLIYNTMSIAIIRQRPDIGTLRAIGTSRQQIFVMFFGEALIIGLIGTVLGLGLGMMLAQGAVEAVSETVANLYTGQVTTGFYLNPWSIAQAFGFGILMTLLGAFAPLVEATSVAPAEASRRASYESKVDRLSGKLTLLGFVFAGIAFWAYQQPPLGDLPVYGFLSALGIILSATFFMPFLVKIILIGMLPILKVLFQVEGRLAALILRGALARTAVAVVSLMIGIAMMVSLAVMIGSFRETVITWVQQTLRADLWVDPVSRFNSKQTGRIDPAVVAKIRQLPEIAAVDAFYEFPIEYQGNPTNFGTGDFDVLARYGKLLFMEDEPTTAVLQRTLDHPAVIITESFATRNQVNKGDFVTLQTPSGLQPFRVEGIYYDYASDLGYIVMPRRWYRQFYKDDSITNLAIYLKPGTAPREAEQAIGETTGGNRLIVRNNMELKAEVLRVFDRTFSITYALHIIAIAVALLGVMNSLFAMVLEARREFGILKYLGASEYQIGKIVLVEAGLLGLFGNISGLIVGFLLSFLLIYVINKQSFGWTIQFAIPTAFLVQSFLLVLVTALLSGLIPARLAARTPAPEVIKSE